MSESIYNNYIVYETTNLVNGKYYIGVHCGIDDGYLGSGKILKQALDKHGRENFMRETLREFDNEQDAYDYEKLIVNDFLVENKNCYNIVSGGGNPPTFYGENNHMYGKHHSDKTKQKISNANKGCIGHNKGKPLSDETKQKLRDSHNILNKEQEKECIELCLCGMLIKDIAIYFKVSLSTIHRYLQKNDECNIQMKNNRTNIGDKNYMFGKTHSEEAKEKIRESRIGKIMSDETKKKISDRMSGKNHPNYGKTHSEETIQNMRNAKLKFIYHIKNEIFTSLTDAAIFFGIGRSTIFRWCKSPNNMDCYSELINE